jgi:anti-sigma regulatory factor (Ser/Thr protein kinase)
VRYVPAGESQAASLDASELHIPALRSALGAARRYAGEVAAAFGLDADSCYEFVYAVNEAVTNAIRHGAADEHGMIHLSVHSEADRLTFTVRDRGTFVAPARNGTATSERGRGLALMADLADEVQLHTEPGRTTVRLSKARSPECVPVRTRGG